MQLTKLLAALPFVATAVYGLPMEDDSSHKLEARQLDYSYPKSPSPIPYLTSKPEPRVVVVRDR